MTIIKSNNINWWKVFFVIFVAAYASFILIKASLGPENDYMFLRTLQVGKPLFEYNSNFLYFNPIKDGRFMPLGTIEYNVVGFFSKSPSPFWYFFIHAFEYILFATLLVKILSKFTSNKFLIYITPALLSLTPGMILSWLPTLSLNERSLMFYFTIFLFFYLQYLEKPKLYYLIFGVISANLAIYCKENAFLALGAFAFFHLVFSWKDSSGKINPVEQRRLAQSNLSSSISLANTSTKNDVYHDSHELSNKLLSPLSYRVKIFDGLVLSSSVLFAIIYFFYVFLPYRGLVTWNKTTAPFVTFIKGILNSAVVIDPIMMLIVLPLTGWRLYRILIKRDKPEVFYDSLLFGVLMFLLALFIMNTFSDFHYFIPMYIFAILPLFYFIPKIWNEKLIWKILVFVAGFMMFFNILPLSLHYLTYFKYMPINFNKTLDFLVNDIKSKSLPTGRQAPNKRAVIFLDGVERCGGRAAMYFSYSEFLLYKGLTPEQFDLKSDQEKTPNCDPFTIKIPLDRFTVFQKGPLPKISKGDYLIVSPQSSDDIRNNSNANYLKSLNNDYDLVFKTESPLAFPMLNLKEIGRYLLSIGASPGQKFLTISRKQPILAWPDYYIFIHK